MSMHTYPMLFIEDGSNYFWEYEKCTLHIIPIGVAASRFSARLLRPSASLAAPLPLPQESESIRSAPILALMAACCRREADSFALFFFLLEVIL